MGRAFRRQSSLLRGTTREAFTEKVNFIWSLKTGCSLELEGKALQVEGFLCTQAQSWGVWAVREPEVASMKVDQITNNERW